MVNVVDAGPSGRAEKWRHGYRDPTAISHRIKTKKEIDMTDTVINRYDRLDENFTLPAVPPHVVVDADNRGGLSLKNDRAQHRRYTALYSDLQN